MTNQLTAHAITLDQAASNAKSVVQISESTDLSLTDAYAIQQQLVQQRY